MNSLAFTLSCPRETTKHGKSTEKARLRQGIGPDAGLMGNQKEGIVLRSYGTAW